MRRCGQARKRDTAEAGIVSALRKIGATVIRISGEDAPDLLVKYRGTWVPLEVKTGKGRITDGQAAMDYPIVRTEAEAIDVVIRQS